MVKEKNIMMMINYNLKESNTIKNINSINS